VVPRRCTAITGAEVVTAATEAELLLNWADFVRRIDPDIITGYNTQNFDMPYLLNRVKTLERKTPKLAAFHDLSRVRGHAAKMRDTRRAASCSTRGPDARRAHAYRYARIRATRNPYRSIQSAQMGKRENIETTILGRVMFDLLPYMFRNHKLSSYSLNSVCAEFLGMQKEDARARAEASSARVEGARVEGPSPRPTSNHRCTTPSSPSCSRARTRTGGGSRSTV